MNKGSLICLICVSSIGPLFKYYDWISSGVGPWSKELTSCLILDYVYVCIESQLIFSWVYWHKRGIWALFYTQRTLCLSTLSRNKDWCWKNITKKLCIAIGTYVSTYVLWTYLSRKKKPEELESYQSNNICVQLLSMTDRPP